jgi:SET domain-containing protein
MAADLIIRSSAIHAAGCYTLSAVPKGQIVVEYDGPRIPKELADERYSGRDITYLFGLQGTDNVIDGFSAAMFINHHCDPNCESEEENGRIFIRAIRPIKAGEELTYMYNLYDSDEESQDCYCGAPNCRKTMFSDIELRRRKRLAKKALKKKWTTRMPS